jgi:hypothetical protein
MKYFLFAIAMAFDLFFLGSLFAKYREVNAAKRWRETSGRILTSRVEVRRVQRSSDDADTRTATYDLRNFAAVTYAIAEDGNIEPKIGVRGRFSENSQQISLIAGNLAGADPFGETASTTMISQ